MAKTFEEWKKLGYYPFLGEKAVTVRSGKAYFLPSQVFKK